jgi:hypothetical protein
MRSVDKLRKSAGICKTQETNSHHFFLVQAKHIQHTYGFTINKITNPTPSQQVLGHVKGELVPIEKILEW